MTFAECYSTLGLRPGASLSDVQVAYKRLAMRHHPDRSGDDDESCRVFCRVTEAYARLKGVHHARLHSRQAGECPTCGGVRDLFIGLHGHLRCADCLLGKRRRYLPLPTYRQIRCFAAMVLLAAAVFCLYRTARTADPGAAFTGFACVLAAMASLGLNVRSADIIEL